MISKAVVDTDPNRPSQPAEPAPRDLESIAVEVQRRLGDASRALDALSTQQAGCVSLLRQAQVELDSVVTLSREMQEVARQKPEEPAGMVAKLQAAVEMTRDKVVDQVEHVREQAIAAFHRMKGDDSRADAGRRDGRSC